MVHQQRISSGAPWEAVFGYSRAVRTGSLVWVAGTTALGADGQLVGPGDAYLQTRQILKNLAAALHAVGASLQDVVRTRIFVRNIDDWEAVGRAHAEVFGKIRPAATLVEVNALIDEEMLVEIEADACIARSPEAPGIVDPADESAKDRAAQESAAPPETA
jgi:enamine deaminase RidA (YjgF/YER057c/UK114 family)